MGQPAEYDEFGTNQWLDRKGKKGVISQLQAYAGVSNWRSRKTIREIISRTLTDHTFDAGVRENMRKNRKRKMIQSDADLAGKMLRHGSGTHWAATFVNNKIINDASRGEKHVITRRTLERTLKGKYDALVHRRQSKKTGSKDKNSVWAKSRLALTTQLLIQLGTFCM